MKVKISKRAENDLDDILTYISEQGYPETASRYINRMKEFTYSLSSFYEKYPFCRHPKFQNANFRCAVFENTYVFIYKVEIKYLKLIRIIHGKNLTY